jgi:hypothetical protein
MNTSFKVLGLALAFALTGCGGKSDDVAGPNVPRPNDPPPNVPEIPAPNQGGVQGSYVLERINDSEPGQLVTISNPDGRVIGLYRFQPTTLIMDPLQTFELQLRYSDDKTPGGIDDEGEFKGGPVDADGALPLTFYSAVYDDQFTGVVLNGKVGITYDFDGDGELDTFFSFRLVPGD